MTQRATSFVDRFLFCQIFNCLDRFFNPCLAPDEDNEDLAMFLTQFEQVSFYNDPYYGEVYLLCHLATEEMVILRKETHTNIADAHSSYVHHLELKNNRNTHIINLLGVDEKYDKGFMFDIAKVTLVYDYIYTDLQQEMDNRMLQNKPYDEQELMLVMSQCIHGLYYLENRQISHRAVRPRYLYITRDRRMKVGYRALFNYQSNYDSVRFGRSQKHIYLSPEEMEDIGHGLPQSSNYEWRSNVFSFGMIMLSMMSNCHLDAAYDYSNFIMRRQRIDEALKMASTKYSGRIIGIVQSMLRDVNRRVSFQKLAEKLMSTSGQPVFLTLMLEPGMRQTGGPYYTFDRPQRFDPASYPNNLSKLMFPGRAIHTTQVISQRNRLGRLYDQNNEQMTLAPQLISPMNAIVNYENGDTFFGRDVDVGSLQKQGKGLLLGKAGHLYNGQWKDNKMHGFGLLYWPTQQVRYEGQFFEGMFHGKGVEYPQGPPMASVNPMNIFLVNNWKKYQGEYQYDLRSGRGIIHFLNGWWQGNFRDGQPHGEGVWHSNNPMQNPLYGFWNMGTLIPSKGTMMNMRQSQLINSTVQQPPLNAPTSMKTSLAAGGTIAV